MKWEKLFFGAISVLILAAAVTGCGQKQDDTIAQDSNVVVSDTNAETTRLTPNLPNEDYGGYDFKILSQSLDYNVHWWSRDIGAEEENGDPINDAVYRRNTVIEEKYNVEIVNCPSKDPSTEIKKTVTAGEPAYDLLGTSLGNLLSQSVSGYFYNLHEVPYIDLTKPWYDQPAQKQLSLSNKLYATPSDMLIMDKDATWVIMFNKKLITDYNLQSPYDYVKNGTWTLDKMYEMMQAVGKDLNGDGKYDDTDQYGLVTQINLNSAGFFDGCGEKITSKDDNDLPTITMYDDRAVQVWEKVLKIQADPNLTIRAEDWVTEYPNDTVWDGMQLVVFDSDRSLFYYAGNNRVTLLRGMETPFGIIPAPKYDETQEKYYSIVSIWCANSIAIPVCVDDVERSGVITEALSAESYYTLTPAYYDITLKTKLARDDESGEMLDIIFGNRTFELTETMNWGGLWDIMNDLTKKNSSDISSAYSKKEKAALAAIDKVVKELASLEQ
jgi:hypothetical protein